MAREDLLATQIAPEADAAGEDVNTQTNQTVKRRSFLQGMGVAGVALSAGALDLIPLDSDMHQYIHDNTEDELTHEVFINAYLESKGEAPANLDKFRTLPSSKATGANKEVLRLTNLMHLTVDNSWWTRYRSRTKNPDFGDTFAPAVPTLAVGQHPAIPRTDDDANHHDFFQAIVNTAGFHFATIEQGGTSLYPSLAQRVSSSNGARTQQAGSSPRLHISSLEPQFSVAETRCTYVGRGLPSDALSDDRRSRPANVRTEETARTRQRHWRRHPRLQNGDQRPRAVLCR